MSDEKKRAMNSPMMHQEKSELKCTGQKEKQTDKVYRKRSEIIVENVRLGVQKENPQLQQDDPGFPVPGRQAIYRAEADLSCWKEAAGGQPASAAGSGVGPGVLSGRHRTASAPGHGGILWDVRSNAGADCGEIPAAAAGNFAGQGQADV